MAVTMSGTAAPTELDMNIPAELDIELDPELNDLMDVNIASLASLRTQPDSPLSRAIRRVLVEASTGAPTTRNTFMSADIFGV
jgi:hypothetical protein